MNDSKEGHYWHAVVSSQKKIAYCSVSHCTFVGACMQIVQLKGGDWFHVLIFRINFCSKPEKNQNIMSFDTVERKKEQTDEIKQEQNNKLCGLTPLIQEPFRGEHYQHCCTGTSWRRIQASPSFQVHTSNSSKATILVDARCDFEQQEEGGRLPLGGLRTVGRHKAGDKSIVPTTSCHALKESICPVMKSWLYLVTILTNCSSCITQKEGPIICNES